MAAVLVSSPLSSSDCAHDGTPDTPGAPTTATHTDKVNTNFKIRGNFCICNRLTHYVGAKPPTDRTKHTLVLFLSAFSSEISSSFSSSCSRHMFSSFVRVANSYKTVHKCRGQCRDQGVLMYHNHMVCENTCL